MYAALSQPRLWPPLVYGYASVAVRDRNMINTELREQAEAIANECDRLGLELIQIITEREPMKRRGLSRPGLEYALSRIKRGDGDGLVVLDLSRLTRSAVQLGAILQWVMAHGLRLVSVAEEIDTAEPSGRVAIKTLIGFSNRERARITERTRRGLESAREAARQRRPAVTDDPDLRERIRRMREENMSLQAIADALNAEGVPTVRGGAKWRPSSLQAVTGYRRKKPAFGLLLSGDAS
jgi:DNA invertase Pin-like site-specific DNA recombinase